VSAVRIKFRQEDVPSSCAVEGTPAEVHGELEKSRYNDIP
jgi:hypothetical protein